MQLYPNYTQKHVITYTNLKKMKEFFSQSKLEHEKLLVNLTRDCWVTDNEIERLFSILNKQYDEVMCVVCTPDKYVNDFLKSKCTMVKFF